MSQRRGWAYTLGIGVLLSGAVVHAANVDDEEASESELPGYLGYGVGIEFPMVGVQTGMGANSDPGAGYYLGAALSWEFTPGIAVRLYGGGGETYGGRANIAYERGGETQLARQDAELVGAQLGLGATYLMRSDARKWTPFVGLDAGMTFQGYYYTLDPSLALGAFNDSATRFGANENESVALGWAATLRTGIELELLRWLRSNLEFDLTFTSQSDEPVSNTIQAPNVRAQEEPLIMARLVFSFWVGF